MSFSSFSEKKSREGDGDAFSFVLALPWPLSGEFQVVGGLISDLRKITHGNGELQILGSLMDSWMVWVFVLAGQ